MSEAAPGTNIAVEGHLDEAVLTKILSSTGTHVLRAYGKRGKDYLRAKVHGYNAAARYGKWVVLVDLNQEAECAPPLVRAWLPTRNPNLHLRVVVHAVEAWLLADAEAIACFLKVPVAHIPANPEEEMKPKVTLINIARQSRDRSIREDVVPRPDSDSKEGPGYTSRLIEFVLRGWNPQRAAARSPSLKRTVASLSRWKKGEQERGVSEGDF